MAVIPEYQRQVRDRAINQTAVSVSTNADTFGANIGEAAQNTAGAVFDVADAVDFRDQLTEKADAQEALNSFRLAKNEILLDPNKGLLTQTGANGLDVQERGASALEEERNKFGEGLSPRARKTYDEQTQNLITQTDERLLSHSATVTRDYVNGQAVSTIEGFVEEAASNWNNQELFDTNLQSALAEQTRLGALQGWDAETQAREGDKLVSKTYRQRIVQMAANDPLGAQGLIENAAELLSAEDEYALRTNLKPLVQEAQVNAAIQPFIGSGIGASSDPYEAQLAAAEGGAAGNMAANNPDNPGFASADGRYSSALGSRQYLRGTYLSAVKQLQAAGGAKWAEGMTENEIALTRTNPDIEGEVHGFVRGQSQDIIRNAGHGVTPTSEYAVHHFGQTGGIALLNLARDKPQADLLEVFGSGNLEAVLKANPQFRGKTAGEAYDWLAAHLGADAATANGATFFDANGAMKAAMQITDPEVQRQAMLRVSQMMSLQDTMNGRDRQEAQEEAWQSYVTTGSTAVPTDLRLRMGQGGWDSFKATVRNDQNGIDVTNPDTWDTLTQMMSRQPKEFSELNLNQYYPNLSNADRRHFVTAQEATRTGLGEINKDAETARNTIPFERIYSDAAPIYEALVDATPPSKQTQEDRQRQLQFQRQLTALTQQFYDTEKRTPNTSEVREMAATLAAPVTFSAPDAGFLRGGFDRIDEKEGFFFEGANRADGTGVDLNITYDSIPTADRAVIAEQLTIANDGRAPSQEQIVEEYEQRKLMSIGAAPTTTIDEVPQWLIDEVRGDNADVSDADLVLMYHSFLMAQ